MVRVRPVNRVGFSFAYVDRKRLAAVALRRVIGLSVLLHKVAEKRIRARRIVGRIGEVENVLDSSVGKPDLVFPTLKQVLGWLGATHPICETAELLFVTHRPVLDAFHSYDGIVGTRESDAPECGLQLVQPMS